MLGLLGFIFSIAVGLIFGFMNLIDWNFIIPWLSEYPKITGFIKEIPIEIKQVISGFLGFFMSLIVLNIVINYFINPIFKSSETLDNNLPSNNKGPIIQVKPQLLPRKWIKISRIISLGMFLSIYFYYKLGMLFAGISSIAVYLLLTDLFYVTPPRTSYVFAFIGMPFWASSNGPSFKIPILMYPVGIVDKRFYTAADNVPTEEGKASEKRMRFRTVTKDNVPTTISATIIYRAISPLKAFFTFNSPETDVPAILQSCLSEICAQHNFLDLQFNRYEISEEAVLLGNEKLLQTGFEVYRIAIDEPIPSEEVHKALGEKRAAELLSDIVNELQTTIPENIDDNKKAQIINNILMAKLGEQGGALVFTDGSLGKNGNSLVAELAKLTQVIQTQIGGKDKTKQIKAD